MRIVVDTNRVIAALIRDSVSRHILEFKNVDFISIGVLEKEISMHQNEIMRRAGITMDEFSYILSKIMGRVTIPNDRLMDPYMPEAKKVMDKIDKGDTPFIAAALATEAIIWTDDKHFEKQKRVPIISTKELMAKLKIS